MFRKRHPPAGSQPGSLVIDKQAQRPRISVLVYSPERAQEYEIREVAEIRGLLRENTVAWIDVQGLGDEQLIREIGGLFQLHPLALEDAVNTPQRPKLEAHESYVQFIVRMALLRDGRVDTEQVSLFVGENYVLTMQERYGDVFDRVRNRIRQGGPVFRRSGSEYLAYALADAVIDGYFPVTDQYGERLEALHDEVMSAPRPPVLRSLHALTRELLEIRRSVWAMREVVGLVLRDALPRFTDRTRVHFRDCYDHCVQIVEVIDTYRELAGGLLDIYLSSVSNRQNEVMKTLTVVASIFIPLTFLAGVYGMNFEHMPELHAEWGYPAVLAVMFLLALLLVLAFWQRGWLGSSSVEDEERTGK